jgi:calcineurin-like phosphoesterase family protein
VTWVLGDLAVSRPDRALALLNLLPGRKHLIVGNHDRCHPMHRTAHKHQRAYLDVFDSVQAFARRRIGDQAVLLSHFPYASDHTDEVRYTQYRLRDEGMWLLHGHTHGPERRHGHEIHVGVDAWDLAPVSLEQIESLMGGDHDDRARHGHAGERDANPHRPTP